MNSYLYKFIDFLSNRISKSTRKRKMEFRKKRKKNIDIERVIDGKFIKEKNFSIYISIYLYRSIYITFKS